MRVEFRAAAVGLALLAACAAPAEQTADLILGNGAVYLGRDAGAGATTVAISGDEILYVGDAAGADRFRAPATREIDLGGRLLLPGLHDVHIHPLGIVPPGGCDLASAPLALAGIAAELRDCLAAMDADPGWLVVSQWNFTYGNEPDPAHPTMRAALDAVSREIPILLLGNDGHHGAVNSAALARARNAEGNPVGLDRATLRGDFAAFVEYVGVDGRGEPNGHVNETARELFGAPTNMLLELPPASAMPAIAQKLARYGITSIRDAAARVEALPLYDHLYAGGGQTFRLSLALLPDLTAYRGVSGAVETGRIVEDFSALRERYADNPLIRADAVKIFVDGVLEGDPRSHPPALPNAAQLVPYRQPVFDSDPRSGALAVAGYVDTDKAVCKAVRRDQDRYRDPATRQAFLAEHGFHPGQCTVSRGVLEHPRAFIDQYIAAFDAAGFIVHAHAIGDRAVRIAVEAFSRARRDGGRLLLPHGIGHAQLVHPDDVPRIAALGLNVAFTFAWIIPDLAYDLTVVPFVDEVPPGLGLYASENYTFRHSYPVASLLRAGAVITAGSDAPVDTREPRPFENIEQAITRANEQGEIFNAAERIDIHAALAAYTQNGALALGQGALTGTIEAGKKADLVVVDQNIVELAEAGRAQEIGATRVLMTLFDGDIVYVAPHFDGAVAK